MPVQVLVVCGSTNASSLSRKLSEIAWEAVREAGAEAHLLDLRQIDLPIFCADDPAQPALPQVRHAREMASSSDGLVVVTPEYHGNMSGALKNWLDYLWPELAGKLAAVITVSGGHGGDMSTASVRNSLNWCHAFTLPYAVNAHRGDFKAGELTSVRVLERMRRLAFDVVRYAPVLCAAFEQAKAGGRTIESGFAGLHVEEDEV